MPIWIKSELYLIGSESCNAKFSLLDERIMLKVAGVEDLDWRNNFRVEATAIRGQLGAPVTFKIDLSYGDKSVRQIEKL